MGVIGTTVAAGIRRLALSDPEGRNALDAVTRAELATELRNAFEDPEVRAIVVGSDARNFSTGGNLADVATHTAGQGSHRMMRSVNELASLMHNSPKPLIAAVSGNCIGAGAGLALLCDVIVCGQSARFGFPFIKLGLVPDFGVSFSLPRRVGVQAARKALMEGLTYSGADALAIGLVDACVEDEQVSEAALDKAIVLAAAPAYALLQIRSMLRSQPTSLDAALEAEALHQSLCFGSADLAEGIAALKERRPAVFVSMSTVGDLA